MISADAIATQGGEVRELRSCLITRLMDRPKLLNLALVLCVLVPALAGYEGARFFGLSGNWVMFLAAVGLVAGLAIAGCLFAIVLYLHAVRHDLRYSE